MNRWNIPEWLEVEVRARDICCTYCGCSFQVNDQPRRQRPSWEHIINDAALVSRENIALCCIGCNASKGAKSLQDWLGSKYCVMRSINEESIAPIARASLRGAGVRGGP